MLAITIMGVYTGVVARSLFFNPDDEWAFRNDLDFERIRIDTARFPLRVDDEIFIVTRVGGRSAVLTWIGIYGHAVEPGTPRPGGYKAVGIWFIDTAPKPRFLIPLLREAKSRLDRELDAKTSHEWKANFNNLTLRDLYLEYDAVVRHLGTVPVNPDGRGGIGWSSGLAACCVDISPNPGDANLAAALKQVQVNAEFGSFNKAFVTDNPRLAARARDDRSLGWFQWPSVDQDELSALSVLPRTALITTTGNALGDYGMGQSDPLTQIKALEDVMRQEVSSLRRDMSALPAKVNEQQATRAKASQKEMVLFIVQIAIAQVLLTVCVFLGILSLQPVVERIEWMFSPQAQQNIEIQKKDKQVSDLKDKLRNYENLVVNIKDKSKNSIKDILNKAYDINTKNQKEKEQINQKINDDVVKFEKDYDGFSNPNPPSAASSVQDTSTGSSAPPPKDEWRH